MVKTLKLIALIQMTTGLLACAGQVDMQLDQANPTGSSEPVPQSAQESVDLNGMFVYLADAALFRDCSSGRSFPVAMEEQYIELERAYLNSGVDGGSEVYVRLTGRYLERPAMEGNADGVNLIVDRFGELLPDETCQPGELADLQDTYWKLLEIYGQPVTTQQDSREAHLILSTAKGRAHGYSGCNEFQGSYLLREGSLSFLPMISTLMACPEGMDTEQAFMKALGETNKATVNGQFLELYNDKTLLARFEAIYL